MVARVVLMAVFALSLLVGVTPGHAQEATPAPAALDLPAWVQAWITTQEEEDLFGFTDLYTGKATYEVLGDGAKVYDKISIREVSGFHAADTQDFTIAPTAFYEGEGWAMLEYTMGWVTSPPANVPVTGIRVATVFILDDEGLITRSSDYYDGLEVSDQLGHIPSAGHRN